MSDANGRPPGRWRSDEEPTVEIRRSDPVRDGETQEIPRIDPFRDGETQAIPRIDPTRDGETHAVPRIDPSRSGTRLPGPALSPPAHEVARPVEPTERHTSPSPTAPVEEPVEEPQAEEEEKLKHGRTFHLVRELAIVAGIALTLSLVVKTFLMQPFWIPSGSMNNTLVRGDRVIVSKLTPGPFDLKRGDVVVFEDPDGWLQEQAPEPGPLLRGLEFVGLYPAGDNHLIKRLIGLPGDHVVCCDKDGRLTVNGVPLDEPYVFEGDKPSEAKFDITVPEGRIWVMGDHRSDSSDSRFHDDGTGATGSVPEANVTGRAVALVWPLGRMDWLSDYPATFDKVPNP